MNVYFTRKGDALKLEIEPSNEGEALWLADVLKNLRNRKLVGTIISQVEVEDSVPLATLLFEPEEEDFFPNAQRPPKQLLN